MKDSFILYTEQKEVVDKLSDEQAGKIFKAIYEYVQTNKMPKLDGLLDIIIIPFKQSLDRNTEKWEEIKKKRSEAGKKGAEIKKQNLAKEANANFAKNKIANQAVNVNVPVPVNVPVNVNDNNIASEDKSSTATAKASKHKYGIYKHVLLKDEELQSLQKDYSNWEELIKYLDEYIEMKGYKAKSHYLCIKKWVVDAVKKQSGYKPKKETFEQRDYGDLSYLIANKGE